MLLPSTQAARLTRISERAGPSDPQSQSQSLNDLPTVALPTRLPDEINIVPSTTENPDLWKSAYDKFREDEHDLLESYDNYVFGAATVNAYPSREDIETALTNLQEERERKQWRITVLNRDIKIRLQIERLANVLKWSDPLVKAGLNTQPYASLAWSGVSLLLPVSVSAAKWPVGLPNSC